MSAYAPSSVRGPDANDDGQAGIETTRSVRFRPIATGLLAWLAMLGVDFLLHAGILAGLYMEASPFLVPPERAFALIPLGYAAFLMLAFALVWLAPQVGARGASAGFLFGLKFGALVWGALVLGLASISTASPALLLGWFVGQTLELGVGGAVVGAALGGTRLRTIGIGVTGLVFATFILAVALQSFGLAPAVKVG